MLRSDIDAEKPVSRQHGMAYTSYCGCSYPKVGYGYNQPIAPVDMVTATEARPVVDTKTAYRSGQWRRVLCRHPHGRQVFPAPSTGPTTALDNR
jgi:hypothetical protein